MKNLINLRIFYLYLTMLSAILFASCQKSDEEPNNLPPGKGKVIFNLHTPGTFLTRGADVDGENGGTKDKIAFYQFNKEGKYEQRYVLNYAVATSVNENNNTRSYSLELTSSTKGEKRFIIVESGNESNFPSMSESNTINDLLNSKTIAENGKLNPPFVMSNVKTDGKEYVTVANVESPENQVNVKLKRRVARFDLLNDPTESGVVIDKVYIKNRYTQGFIGDVSGNAGNISADMLEIPAADLANDRKSFYLYPTQLTSILDQNEKTVVWATTKLANTNTAGPTLYLNLASDINVEANYLYQLNTKRIAGSAGFDISVEEWKDGTSIDWVTVENGISSMDNKAMIIAGTEIKGTYVKIGADATMPYTIKRVVTDYSSTTLEALYDGSLPSWLTVLSSTTAAGSGLYRHEIIYTVTGRPGNSYQYAVTYLNGSVSDENLLVIGFIDPYPGTPLPCLSWGNKLYSPIHAKQTTYLTHNHVDKVYYCGAKGYAFNTNMSSIKNDVSINPCPDGWSTLNDKEAEDYISWVGKNLKSQVTESVYAYRWFEPVGEGTYMRILAGYPTAKDPNLKDLATFGTWPNVAWVNIKLSDLTVQDQTFGNAWVVKDKYGIPYRCIRDKADWN
ncbi:hypothetical protein GGR06_001739 [Bacteroides reticulotermitis]|uniref:Fibrobacter succinogenes major paralogous domain-containing protein n=1 Tax=Bacteroides reticulotermitis TaxID=1133319 RepID=A0A840CVP4_9BACE|nr:hypothetical protein [Bacteroides reticulotermitis]MBB4043950.1 hypothetical protein [Bacteroides reticulotermitis]